MESKNGFVNVKFVLLRSVRSERGEDEGDVEGGDAGADSNFVEHINLEPIHAT